MAIITRTYIFTDGTVAYGSQVDSEIANIVNVINSLDAGTTTWDVVKLASIIPTAPMDFASQRIKNLGAPTTTNDAARYPITDAQMSANTLTAASMAAGAALANLAANAISQVVQSSSGGSSDQATTITTKSITTSGGIVIILATATISVTSATSGGTGVINFTVDVTRGGTSIPSGEAVMNLAGVTTGKISELMTAIITTDTPAAGTYTYNFTYGVTTGSAPSVIDYSLTLIELKR